VSELSKLWEQFDSLRSRRDELKKELRETQAVLLEVIPLLRGAIYDSAEAIGELTRREMEILTLVRQHKQNKEIANQLNVSTRTVSFHVARLLRKMGVASRHEL
jgi:DNA-binding NarL/FixJ family response regulator